MQVRPGRLVVAAVALAILAGVAGGLVGAALRPGSDGGSRTLAAVPNPAGCDVAQVAAQVFPSLVTVHVRRGEVAGSGSGSVLDTDGHILTNDHVIAPAIGGTVTVDFARGPGSVPATVVGRDPATDLAVLRVRPEAARLTPIVLGDSAGLVVGQPVVAAGSPLGLTGTITAGVVSALGRFVDVGPGDTPAALVNAVQTDASVNPGNSGGPLTDCAGRQVGVNSAGAQTPDGDGGSIGLNFAIPIDFAESVAGELIRTGKVTHPVIGVLSVSVTAEMAAATGMPRGALAETVLPGLGAARAGLQPGDVITKVGSTAVSGTDQMLVAVRLHAPGDTVAIEFRRGSSSLRADVSVTEV